MEPLLTRLLDHYSLTEEGLAALSAEPSFSLLPDLSDSLAALEAKSAIASTIAGRGKILVYGDYDCDGIMATSIMVRTLSALGARVEYFIPSRYKDGYGLTLDNAKKIAAKDFALLILVDNGVSCLEPVAYLLEKGLKTIIIDHHDLPVSLPPSLALVHDQLLAFPDKCSAGALCFFFSRLLLGYDDQENAIMGAISILSDLMPMKGYNRTLVALSLRLFRQGYGQAFLPLMEGDIIDERTLSLKANSKINAVGRVRLDYAARLLVGYFSLTEKDKSQPLQLMNECQNTRKQLSKEAESSLELSVNERGAFAVSSILEGLSGLLANRVLEKTGKMTLIACASHLKEGTYVASIRGRGDFDSHAAVASFADRLLSYGGHRYAAGMSFRYNDLGLVKDAFLRYCSTLDGGNAETSKLPLSLSEINMDSYRLLRRFGPFGVDWPAPEFVVAVDGSALLYSPKGFLSTPLANSTRLFSFSIKEGMVEKGKKANIKGRLSLSRYQGRVSLDFLADSYEQEG